MKIDNKLTTGKIRMTFILVFSTSIILLLYSILSKNSISGHYMSFIISILLFLLYIILHIIDLNYIFYNDEKDKVILRYYYAHPFLRKYRAIEIHKNKLAKYEIKSSFLGLRHELILYQKTNKGDYKYPSVSISSLSKNDRNKIENSINVILRS